LDLESIGAKAPFASDLLCPDPARSRHTNEGVGVEPEYLRSLSSVEEAVGVHGQMRTQPFSELACRGVVERAEQGVSEGRAVRTPPIV
jgi:hypothetical protein